MGLVEYCLRKLIAGLFLVFGVTLISFVLMVYFGPDNVQEFLPKNPTQADIDRVRAALHLDDPFLTRYVVYVKEILTLDFGSSFSSGQNVNRILAQTIPISLAVIIPGFVLGNLLGLLFALIAANYRSSWIDKLIMAGSVVGMSISLLIVVIVAQILLCSEYGLNLFPSRGWRMGTFGEYLQYVTVPTIATIFVALGYNTRFYRAVLVEELSRDHVRTARAFGAPPSWVMLKHVLKNALIPISTRILFSIPLVVISGSLVIESYFGIPGVGKITFDAIRGNDQPILKAVVSLTAVLFVVTLVVTDIVYRIVDPRVDVK
ncbi:MAG: ABC transporter permease [Gammaproteobacteria bacterium]